MTEKSGSMPQAVLKAAPPSLMEDPLIPIPIPAQPEFREGVADLGRAKLWFTDTGGERPAVVLLHPASGSGMIWLYQRPALVEAGFRVVTYSRRSCFGSSPIDPADPGVGAEDLNSLADYLGLGRFHLVCCAAGGSIGADFALSYPGRLHSLVVSSNHLGVTDGSVADAAVRIRPEGWHDFPRWFRELGPSYRAANPDGVARWIELERRGAAPEGLRQKVSNEMTEGMLCALQIPILLMTGAADTSTPPAVLRLLGKRIPNCDLFIVDECGHSVYWERPDVFNVVTIEFLQRL